MYSIMKKIIFQMKVLTKNDKQWNRKSNTLKIKSSGNSIKENLVN